MTERTREVWTYGGRSLDGNGKVKYRWIDDVGVIRLYGKKLVKYAVVGEQFELDVERCDDSTSAWGNTATLVGYDDDHGAELKVKSLANEMEIRQHQAAQRLGNRAISDACDPMLRLMDGVMSLPQRKAIANLVTEHLWRHGVYGDMFG